MDSLIRESESSKRRLSNLEVEDVIPVVARCTSNAGQSITNNTVTIVDFEDVEFDTKGAVTIGAAWKFTAPIGGYYQLSVHIRFNAGVNWADGDNFWVFLYKNGAEEAELYFDERIPTNTTAAAYTSDIVHLNAGDYIDIRVQQVSGGALTLVSSTSKPCSVSIARI